MKMDQIKTGNVYAAKITDKVVPVRIDSVCISLSTGKHGGWEGTNLATNKKVRIKSPRKLRKQITVPDGENKRAAASGGPVKKKMTAAERRARLAETQAKTKAKPKAKVDQPASAKVTGKSANKKKADEPKEKRLSLIDAAVEVLGAAGEAMNCKQMVERITERRLWSPRSGGKTPHATLYSAILRDIQKHGDAARFEKADRGLFTLTKKGA